VFEELGLCAVDNSGVVGFVGGTAVVAGADGAVLLGLFGVFELDLDVGVAVAVGSYKL
jgi:hypothetical protein